MSFEHPAAGASAAEAHPSGFPGIDEMTVDDLAAALREGCRFVTFEYTVSLLLITLKRASKPYLVRPGEGSAGKGIRYTLITLLLGWWGIPWGPIHSLGALYTNLSGGRDVTLELAAENGVSLHVADGRWKSAA